MITTILTVIRYLILILIMWYIPSILKVGYGSASLGSLTSHLTYGLLLIYYFLEKKGKPPWIFLFFAIAYYTLCSFNFIMDEVVYMNDLKKFFILLVCGAEVARNTTLRELYFIVLLGASSILIHAAVFGDQNGRYSGFYLDPNAAGFICLIGVCLSYGFKFSQWRLIGLFFLTFCGVLTFSRTFLLLWFVVNCLAVLQDKKNINVLAMGVGTLLLIISVATLLQLNTRRLGMVQSLFGEEFDQEEAAADSRSHTWSLYYEQIYESPIIGNGYMTFSGSEFMIGVHNVYLRIIGESGIFPLLIFVSIYLFMVSKSITSFKKRVYQFMLALSLMALLMTTHNFISGNQFIMIVSMWLFIDLTKKREPEEEEQEESNLTLANI